MRNLFILGLSLTLIFGCSKNKRQSVDAQVEWEGQKPVVEDDPRLEPPLEEDDDIYESSDNNDYEIDETNENSYTESDNDDSSTNSSYDDRSESLSYEDSQDRSENPVYEDSRDSTRYNKTEVESPYEESYREPPEDSANYEERNTAAGPDQNIANIDKWRKQNTSGSKRKILRMIKHSNLDVRWAAIRAVNLLRYRGALDSLTAIINNKQEDQGLRDQAIQAVSSIGDFEAIPSLLNLLEDREESIDLRLAAVEAIQGIGDIKTSMQLLEILSQEQEAEVQASIIQTLGDFGYPRAVRPVVGFLDESFVIEVRVAAATALGNIPDRNTVGARALIQLLEQGELGEDLTSAAQESLRSLLDNLSGELYQRAQAAIK